MLKLSAFYLEKQKSFIPEKNIFLTVVSKHAKIIPKDGTSWALAFLIFSERFGMYRTYYVRPHIYYLLTLFTCRGEKTLHIHSNFIWTFLTKKCKDKRLREFYQIFAVQWFVYILISLLQTLFQTSVNFSFKTVNGEPCESILKIWIVKEFRSIWNCCLKPWDLGVKFFLVAVTKRLFEWKRWPKRR